METEKPKHWPEEVEKALIDARTALNDKKGYRAALQTLVDALSQ